MRAQPVDVIAGHDVFDLKMRCLAMHQAPLATHPGDWVVTQRIHNDNGTVAPLDAGQLGCCAAEIDKRDKAGTDGEIETVIVKRQRLCIARSKRDAPGDAVFPCQCFRARKAFARDVDTGDDRAEKR